MGSKCLPSKPVSRANLFLQSAHLNICRSLFQVFSMPAFTTLPESQNLHTLRPPPSIMRNGARLNSWLRKSPQHRLGVLAVRAARLVIRALAYEARAGALRRISLGRTSLRSDAERIRIGLAGRARLFEHLGCAGVHAAAPARHILKIEWSPGVGFEPTKDPSILPPPKGGALSNLGDPGMPVVFLGIIYTMRIFV